MAKKSLEPLTEPMYYVLLSLYRKDFCGADLSSYVQELTDGRVRLGPGTLYTILSLFQKEKLIYKVLSEGRKITYGITQEGKELYENEMKRLRKCLEDAERSV
ncbi:MAG: PadR family transcriptional regulator [Blautia sp.]|nr:PadR family transcriptional regulator [Blautia sp.]